MKPSEIKNILLAVNSSENLFKYPIGNKSLTEKLKLLEQTGKLNFDKSTMKWELK